MSDLIFRKVENFIERAKKLGEKYLGRKATMEEIQILNDKFEDKIPSWYYRLISEIPLIHMEIDFSNK